MEGLEFHEPQIPMEESEDLCNSILSRFGNSAQEDHQHLCLVIGTMSQELKDQGLPLTAIAYFGATVSSLNRLSNEPGASDPKIPAFLTLLSMILPRVSGAVLRKKRDFVSEPLVRVLHRDSVNVGAVTSGLKCISHLLIVSDKDIWSDSNPYCLQNLYSVVLRFVTNSDDKIRRQSHTCLCDVLRSFQGSLVLARASDEITKIFAKFFLLAGGSNPNASERPKGAQEVLHILYALKDCLPLMSFKSTTGILKYFKTLLEVRQPIVIRRITDCLHALCIYPTSEVCPEALLDLLCSLASSISADEKSVDGMTFTARLLDSGMRKVYALNRQLCVVKLPLVFNALGEILACEHEEALFAAVEALKSLIIACIDERLIKQGVDQIMVNTEIDARRSQPTVIEKICATIESLLGYQYIAVWDMVFQVVSTVFDKLGEYSSYLLRGTIKGLADMQKLPEEDLPSRKQLHECLGSALGAMGPETFLSLIPLNLEAEDLSEVNIWLLPILKHYTVGAHLSFFTKSILGMVGLMRQKSRKLEQEGRIVSARSAEALAYSLWSLLPAFCNYPLDTAKSFKDLKKALCSALREEPDVHGIICSSLQILIQQNKRLLEENKDQSNDEISIPEQRARAYYTPQVAADNLNALKSSAREFLSVLSGIFMHSSKDSGGSLQSTIGEFASISDKEVVKKFYKTTMQKLLEVTKEAAKAEQSRNSAMQIDGAGTEHSPSLARAQVLDLAVSLLPGLDVEGVDVLFYAIKPALRDDEGLIQKKAYKILSIILRDRGEFLSTKLDDLLGLMIEALPSCHFSAKRHRLDCLYFLTVYVSKDATEQRKSNIISSFLTEIILALKEANRKTRNKAYDILVEIGHACGDENRGGKKEFLLQFFNMVAGGLAGETPHMISAAVKGLARLAYEFSDLVSAAYNLLPSAFLLLQRKNREIMKANLGLLKVLIAKSQADRLQTHLRSMVEGLLLKSQDDAKNHFKAKVKHLLEMLVKKCGLQAVKAVMPEEHMKLLTNIRKINERKERKSSGNSEDEARSRLSKASTSRLSGWNHTKIFSDFGDEDSEGSDAVYMEATTVGGHRSKAAQSKLSLLRSKRTQRAAKSLPEDFSAQLGDDPLDLLDQQKTRSALRSSGHLKRKPDSDDEPEIDSEGRLVVREEGKPKKREFPADPDMDVRSQGSSHVSAKTKSSKQTEKKRRKTSETGWAYTGNEYTSRKAGGDVTRKGKLEPYAYWPLDRKMLSRRPEQRAAARKGMASVVKLTKQFEGKSASSALLVKAMKFKRSQKKSSKKSR
ncbi:RRP12-like protein [Telopea speciosissima]|uniref:RRP12-like protein n=1 Tax=Telopea speciosissima TaxID=54955 RepID=UPI001CC43B1C|nr:RRP12-like protein [Telopea speciosissima]